MDLVIEAHEFTSLPVTVDPEILGATPVFRGTRVPVDALLSNLEAGISIDEFLENFPTVSRFQVLELLKFSRAILNRVLKLNDNPMDEWLVSKSADAESVAFDQK